MYYVIVFDGDYRICEGRTKGVYFTQEEAWEHAKSLAKDLPRDPWVHVMKDVGACYFVGKNMVRDDIQVFELEKGQE